MRVAKTHPVEAGNVRENYSKIALAQEGDRVEVLPTAEKQIFRTQVKGLLRPAPKIRG